MKISILTATYNRGTYLSKLYNSLINNCKFDINLEWLIMDDRFNWWNKKYNKYFYFRKYWK